MDYLTHWCCIHTSLQLTTYYSITQGRSQPHSLTWARVPLSLFFPQISINFSYFSSNFSNFGSPGGQLAHPERPWLLHWHCSSMMVIFFIFPYKLQLYEKKSKADLLWPIKYLRIKLWFGIWIAMILKTIFLMMIINHKIGILIWN